MSHVLARVYSGVQLTDRFLSRIYWSSECERLLQKRVTTCYVQASFAGPRAQSSDGLFPHI